MRSFLEPQSSHIRPQQSSILEYALQCMAGPGIITYWSGSNYYWGAVYICVANRLDRRRMDDQTLLCRTLRSSKHTQRRNEIGTRSTELSTHAGLLLLLFSIRTFHIITTTTQPARFLARISP